MDPLLGFPKLTISPGRTRGEGTDCKVIAVTAH
jgi:hypothetical protein